MPHDAAGMFKSLAILNRVDFPVNSILAAQTAQNPRSRAAAAGRRISTAPAVAVLQPDHVVELGR
jgi:hypothetical protein